MFQWIAEIIVYGIVKVIFGFALQYPGAAVRYFIVNYVLGYRRRTFKEILDDPDEWWWTAGFGWALVGFLVLVFWYIKRRICKC